MVVSQFNGTSTPKRSYSAKIGDNDCNVNSSRYSLSTALCESNSLSGQVWTKCPTRPDTQGRHVEAALMHPKLGLDLVEIGPTWNHKGGGVVSQFSGTSTPKGSYSPKTGDNDCNINSSRYSLSTVLCESNSLSGQVWTKCPTRPDTQGRHVEAAHKSRLISHGVNMHIVYVDVFTWGNIDSRHCWFRRMWKHLLFDICRSMFVWNVVVLIDADNLHFAVTLCPLHYCHTIYVPGFVPLL